MRALADALSWSRLALAPAVIVALLEGRPDVGLGCTAWAIASDVLDGAVARHGRGSHRGGALLDASADMGFLGAGLAALAWLGAVPPILLALMVASFLPFAAGGIQHRVVRYDPLGKHLGTMLYALLALALVVQDSAVVAAGSYAAALVLASSIALRIVRLPPAATARGARVPSRPDRRTTAAPPEVDA
jgi:phosphatidylglycerophosphate synthase